ncbi:MAG TPA: hypothetical protein VNJ31_09475 [Methyloceanibacter sp.]|nr:hypothetical protein [Methyloceanibacter sp.]
MFGVRIVLLAAILIGVAAIVPLDVAEAKPRHGSEGIHATYAHKSVVRRQARWASTKQHSRKHIARGATGKTYTPGGERKIYAYAGRKSSAQTQRVRALAKASSHVGRKSSAHVTVKAFAKASSGLGPRPARWCGWWMRTQLGGGPELNLARNWAKWGRPSGPQVGAVVVWPHHVGIITGRAANGQWIVKSGNDGGRVRERPRSVAGAVFRVA